MAEYPKEVRQRFHGTPEQNAVALVGPRPARWDHIVIEDYDPAWVGRFDAAAALIGQALDGQIIAIEHVGSTSVPGLPAKPVIDIDLLVEDTADESRYVPALEAHGYRLVLRDRGGTGTGCWSARPRTSTCTCGRRTRPSRFGTGSSATGCARIRRTASSTPRQAAPGGETVRNPGRYNLAKNDVIDDIYTRIFAAGPQPGVAEETDPRRS